MKRGLHMLASISCLAAALGVAGRVAAEEVHVPGVVAAVAKCVAQLKAADPEAVPMAFWDFDGTIIKGDIGYGFGEADGVGYPSIIEHTLRAGFSSVYTGEDGFRAWSGDYARMHRIGPWLSQAFDAQMYAGAESAALDAFCTRWIEEQGIPKWYFASSVAIWKALEKLGVENYVVSANVESLVRNAAPSLGIPRGRVRGARVAETGGRLTTRVVHPVPYGEGKVEAVRELVLARPRGVAVAGFGNSYSTDGDFLRFIATQRLPGGAQPMSMMINGGAEPGKYKGLFRLVTQTETVGDAERPLVDCVDPMIGAITLSGYGGHGLGKTFPGAASPFGMVQLSPDTVTGGDNGPGYSYHHETIEGFSFLHMSGIGWYGDLGNFQVMPSETVSKFSHSNETARAGYYSVRLDDCGVKTELTALGDVGVIRFTYPGNPRAELKFDLARRIGELRRAKLFSRQELVFDSDTEFHGLISCDHRDGGWGRGDGVVDYTVHFRGSVSKPLKDRRVTGGNTNLVLHATFPTRRDEAVELALRVSFAGPVAKAPSADGIRFANLLPRARAAWADGPFRGLAVTGGTERQRRIFATAVYHAALDPREVDAPLPNGFTQKRTVFSGWDVFRSEMPWLALREPGIVKETVESMMEVTASGRRDTLPVWDLFGCPSSCMVGNPLIPVMLTLQDVGVPFDERKALEMMVATTAKRGNASCGFTPGSLSSTLEYCFDDACVARFAEKLGEKDVTARFAARAQWYTNVWCAAVGSMRTRTADGSWLSWKGETAHGQGTVESNPLQQGWFVPHDVPGLIGLMGGEARFAAKLESFFEKAPDDFLWGDYYNHPNEPSHHIAYLFPYCGKPWLTQKWTRRILEKAYGDDVRGLCGNDDVGQMSAWYVLSAIGLHPVAPGSGVWILTTPLFESFSMPNAAGGTISVVARGASDPRNVYIRAAKLNGRPLDRAWLTTRELVDSSGCRLEYELGSEPNMSLFSRRPPR